MGRELHVHSHPSGVEHWRHLVEIVALIVAAVWGIYVFVYQERIKPSGEAPRLQPAVSVHRETLSRDKEFVQVEFRLKNISGATASLAGMIVNVYGRRFAGVSGERVETPVNGVWELNKTLVLSQPELLYSYYDTWQPFGAPAPKLNRIGPGAEFTETSAFGIKPGSFDVAKITWMTCQNRPTDRVWPVKRQREADGSFAFTGVDIRPAQDVRGGDLVCSRQRRGEYFAL